MEDKKSQELDFDIENPTLDLTAPMSAQLHRMTAEDWREQFVEEYTTCGLCGKMLQFSHITNFSTLDVEEEAHCMDCRVRARRSMHVLQ